MSDADRTAVMGISAACASASEAPRTPSEASAPGAPDGHCSTVPVVAIEPAPEPQHRNFAAASGNDVRMRLA